MKITLNTDILQKYNLSLGQFLVLLIGYYNLDCIRIRDELIKASIAEQNLFKPFPPVLSDNTKNLIARILLESDPKLDSCDINFEALALELQSLYPDGLKPGTTYPWRGDTAEIAQKLRTLVVKYNFTFTHEEARNAVLEYVQSSKDYKTMHLLRNFILTTRKDSIDSIFMTIIENNRK